MANRIPKSQSANRSTKSGLDSVNDTRTQPAPATGAGAGIFVGSGAGAVAVITETAPAKITPGKTETPNLVIPRKSVSDVAEKYLSESDDAFLVDQTPTPQPDNSSVKDAIYGITGSGRKMAKKEAAQTAIILLALLDGIGTIAFGKDAGMLDYEKDMIKEPLERILQRMDITSSAALAKWSDPIMLFMGLSAWVTRIAREKKEAQTLPDNSSQPVQKKSSPPSKPSNNGQKEKEVYLVENLHTPQFFTEGIQGKPNEF